MPDARLRYTVLRERNKDGGYTVTVPSLPGCISEGSTREETLAHIEEASSGHIEVARRLGKPILVEVSVPLNTGNAVYEAPENNGGEGGQGFETSGNPFPGRDPARRVPGSPVTNCLLINR